MGGVLEFIAAFVLIVYVGGKLVSEGISNADYKRKRAAEDERENKFRERVINKELEKEYFHSVREDESFRREVEKECLEVFAELPSWKWLKTWEPLYCLSSQYQWTIPIPKTQKKKTKEVEEKLDSFHEEVAELIYFANRGYIYWHNLLWQSPYAPHDVMSGIRDVASRSDLELFLQMQKELMIWWREKLHSFGIQYDLLSWYSVYNTKAKEMERVYCQIEDSPSEKEVRSVILYVWEPYIPEQDYLKYRLQECHAAKAKQKQEEQK